MFQAEGTAGAKVLRWELPRMRNCRRQVWLKKTGAGGSKAEFWV